MKRQKICILPQLNDGRGDVSKQWFVFFSFRNPKSEKMRRFKIYDGFTDCRTKKAKYAHSEKLITFYKGKIQKGWTPFNDDEQVIYDDHLQYQAIAKIYGKTRKSNKTFGYYASLFMDELRGYRPKTYNNYKSKYRIFSQFLHKNGLDENDISTITENDTHNFFLFLINDLKLAAITVRKYKHMLERLFNWLIKSGILKISPIGELPECTRENDQAPRPINDYDIKKLIEEIKYDRQLYLAVQLEYYCFLRPGLEVRMAKIEWFDLARGKIMVPKEVVKSKRDKIIVIPNQFRIVLMDKWKLHNYPREYYLIGKNGIPGPEHLGENNLRNRFNIIRDRLGLPKTYKLYSWKHTGNSRAEDAGIPMHARQHQNGHKSMRTTEEYLKNKIGFSSPELENNFPSL